MVEITKIEKLFKNGKIRRISELEIDRYINFFTSSYKDNLAHSKFVLNSFPRWSIISGYYAMHDITKLLLAKNFSIKIDKIVHKTAIQIVKELIKNRELFNLLEKGYNEFLNLANDLEEAKKQRIKVQYYTGTAYMKEEYRKRAVEFQDKIVKVYLNKISELLNTK